MEDADTDFLLPPKQILGPDENGIKKIIEYKFNEEGHKVKTMTTIRVRKHAEARLSKRANERRGWAKFGNAATQDAAGTHPTNVSTQEILLQLPKVPVIKQEGTHDWHDRTHTDTRGRNYDNFVRVTNLSEDTTQADFRELFRPFGSLSQTYVAINEKTGMCRGFGFVNFVSSEDAKRAINELNGYGYDNRILGVSWAWPRSTKME